MNQEEIKKEVKVDNSAYKDRFRFLFSANDNIICERFFKINYFNVASLYSDELKNTIETIVYLIQNDLTSKSRIYTWYTTPGPVKLMGFMPDGQGYKYNTPNTVYVSYPEKQVEPKAEGEENTQTEVKDNYTVTFKFEFQMAQKVEMRQEDGKPMFSDYKSIYTAIWDGSMYPKDIRNSVDLTNSISQYKDWDVNTMNFIRTLNYRMVKGRQDLVYDIIKRICEVTSGEGKTYSNYEFYPSTETISKNEAKNFRKEKEVTFDKVKRDKIGNIVEHIECDVYTDRDGGYWALNPAEQKYFKLVKYSYDPYGDYVRSWAEAVRDKTNAYRGR